MKRKKVAFSELLGERGMSHESSLFVLGNREMSICGCKKVVSYSGDTVKLKNCDGILEINGKGLEISACFGTEIKLRGCINSVIFSRGEGK